MKYSLLVFLIVALCSVFVFSFANARAGDEEYRCEQDTENVCGMGIESRSQYDNCYTEEVCTTSKDEDGNIIEDCDDEETCMPAWTDWDISEDGSPYKICTGGDNPELQCAGQCYPAPQTKDEKDTALSPQNVFENPNKDGQGADEDKLKLPVNLGWNDVNEILQQDPSSPQCTVESYNYELEGDTELVPSPSSEPVLNEIIGDCTLSQSESYQWRVQACGDTQGEECGEWSSYQSFKTSSAPELKTPFDPDWEEEEYGGTLSPTKLEWCPYQNGTRSFAVNIYGVTDPEQGKQGARLVRQTGALAPKTSYSDSPSRGGLADLRKGLLYAWEILACSDADSRICGIPSQFWMFMPQGDLIAPTLLEPNSGRVVNMQDSLKWIANSYETHFVVQIGGKDFFVADTQLPLSRVWQSLQFTSSYLWKVAPCGGSPSSQDIENCKLENGSIPWSEERLFTATGAAPTGLAIKQQGKDPATGKAAIPLLLDWDDMPGAASYYYEVAADDTFSNIVIPPTERILEYSEASPDTPYIKSNTNYWMRVKTCADMQGNVCGDWSSQLQVTTVALEPPSLELSFLQKKEFSPSPYFIWNKVLGANYYEYSLTYASPSAGEVAENCVGGTEVIKPTTTSLNQAQIRLRCLGEYQFKIRSCVDNACLDASPLATQTFQVETFIGPVGGLVPCGRANDDPDTLGINERDPCGIKHVFLLIRNIIDFLLWKLTLIIATIMAIATGAILFFSFGGTEALIKIKAGWKAIGIGALILLFAWFFLNLLLGIVGFNVGIFGNWYQVEL